MIPKSISERWAPMWPAGRLADRPWWNFPNGVRRCDGVTPAREESAPGYWDGKETLAAYVERVDRDHPLPVPPPMPGQVWVLRNGDEVLIGGDTGVMKGVNAEPIDHGAPLIGKPRNPGERFNGEPWPIPGAILVYGPTPWGPNMPWMDTRP